MSKFMLVSVFLFTTGCHYVLGIDENVDREYESESFIAKYSPDATYEWSAVLDAEVQPVSTTLDSSMNILMVGWYVHSTNIGSGAFKDGNKSGLFIAKLNPDGAHIWSRGFGETHDSSFSEYEIRAFPPSIATDNSDNIIITGSYSRSDVDFGDGPLPYEGSESLTDIFLAKFDTDGYSMFAKRFFGLNPESKGTDSTDHGHAVDADEAGNIYLAATAFGDVEIDPNHRVSGNFLAAFSPRGETQWARTLHAKSGDYHLRVSDNGNSLLSGGHQGPVDLGGGIVGEELDEFDLGVFAATFDPAGNHAFSTSFGPNGCPGCSPGGGAEFAEDGSFVVAGTEFIEHNESDDPSNIYFKQYRIFLRKLTEEGEDTWHTTIDLDLSQFVAEVGLNPPVLDSAGNVILYGLFTGTLRVGTGPALGGEIDGDAFIMKFDASGNHLFSMAFERAIPIVNQPISHSYVTTSVAIDEQDNILFMSGYPTNS